MSLRTAELKHNYSLKDFTTIRIGGEAQYFFIVDSIDKLQETIKSLNGSYYLLGAGSNLLVRDSNLNKAVLKLGKGFNYIKANGRSIEVGAATSLAQLIRYAITNRLGGLENLVGIPATCGGLLAMNASSYGKEVSDSLKEVEIIDKSGNLKRLKKENIKFSYRSSSLKEEIVVRAWFVLEEEKDIRARTAYFIHERIQKQDFSFPSCGCIFKNPNNTAAGLLIDACGLKGLSRNGAKVSLKHANFIVNTGNATYNDVDYLIGHIKDKVYQRFGLVLEEEIERWA
jgi:UDP-N-acetylmuramate dehydrogenase